MAYKDSKSRLDLLTKMVNRNKNRQSPLGDICNGTAYLLENSKIDEPEMEQLLKENPLDFLYQLAGGLVEPSVRKDLEVFVRKFHRYCRDFGI